MNTILLLLMGVLGVLTLVMMKKQPPVAAVCAGLIVLLAVGRMVSSFWGPTPAEQHIRKARQVMVNGLAQEVLERYPGGKILVLRSPESKADTAIAAGNENTEIRLVKALQKRGLDVEVLSSPSFQWDDGDDTLGDAPFLEDVDPVELEMMAEWEARSKVTITMADPGPLHDVLIEWKERVDAVILTLPLDPGMAPRDLPVKGQAPPLVLISAPGWSDLSRVMESTVLDLVLLYKPNVSQYVTRPWPRDDAEAFDQRFFFKAAEEQVAER